MADVLTKAMTVQDVEGYLNTDEKPAHRLVQGELQGFKVACAWRFKPSDHDNGSI